MGKPSIGSARLTFSTDLMWLPQVNCHGVSGIGSAFSGACKYMAPMNYFGTDHHVLRL